MNYIYDRLIVRILFIILLCSIVFLYKYFHNLMYSYGTHKQNEEMDASHNIVITSHLFSRLVGISIVLSIFSFNEMQRLSFIIIDYLIMGIIGVILYITSLFLTENIIFQNFNFEDECLKRKNMAWGLISATNAIVVGVILKSILSHGHSSILLIAINWLFIIVLYGGISRLYQYISILTFNNLMVQKNIGLGLSYSSFLVSAGLIINSSLDSFHADILVYLAQTLLKICLAALIFPLIMLGVKFIFKTKINEKYYEQHSKESDILIKSYMPSTSKENLTHKESKIEKLKEENRQSINAIGIFEGCIYVSTAILTSILIGQIYFEKITPYF